MNRSKEWIGAVVMEEPVSDTPQTTLKWLNVDSCIVTVDGAKEGDQNANLA